MEPHDRRRRFILSLGIYLPLLYGTLGITPYFFRWLLRTLGRDSYNLSITLFLILASLTILFFAREQLPRLTLPRLLGLCLVAAGYVAVAYSVSAAAKQLHTLQYGLLVWMVMESLRGRLALPQMYLVSTLLTLMAAGIDESIQAWLPNRNGQVADVVLDGFSILLAQAAIVLIKDHQELLNAFRKVRK